MLYYHIKKIYDLPTNLIIFMWSNYIYYTIYFRSANIFYNEIDFIKLYYKIFQKEAVKLRTTNMYYS